MASSSEDTPQHTAIVLFYQYFLPSSFPLLHKYPHYYEEQLLQHQKELGRRLGLKGRILLASEGINGTLSAPTPQLLQEYIDTMKCFELYRDCGLPEGQELPADDYSEERLFATVDWKVSSNTNGGEPFPDLKISIVKEIISSGGTISVDDIPNYGGKHLGPREFHETLLDYPDAVLIDVRNTFEHDIGHFVHPTSKIPAMNPEMVTFSSFDSICAKHADEFKDKKVLMYCTGGIRCEKASAMLKKRGVQDVNQLQGGIHRYLEEYGDDGCFRGRNFVFDQRVSVKPSDCKPNTMHSPQKEDIVGRCVECNTPFDDICGSRVCTVCRDLVLVCPTCQSNLREYHCRRHADWKRCYFTFLDAFDRDELDKQKGDLTMLRDSLVPAAQYKNMRRTISRQIEKVSHQIEDLDSGRATVDRDAPRRCRTCMDPLTVCDGRCWGFWKTQAASERERKGEALQAAEILPISIGDVVEPGPHWNTIRLCSKTDDKEKLRRGTVVEVKSWGAGGCENDCVAVEWNDAGAVSSRRSQGPQIYRWGVLALNGDRMYDLQH